MSAGTCRGCGARIGWVVMASGKRNPVNPQPDPERGNILICDTSDVAAEHEVALGRGVTLNVDDAQAARERGTGLYLSHFATCPERGRFGKAKRRDVRKGT